jgi:glycine cleavage system aminomethyltransferase T
MAYVDKALTRSGQRLDINAHGKLLPATVVGLPFYKEGTARGLKKP